MDKNDLKKYVLITGATSGIGKELARLFAKDHHNLILVARDENELRTCETELKTNEIDVVSIAKDLSDREAVFSLCAEIEQKGLLVDVLVNDAGQGQYGEFEETDIDRDLYLIDLNIGAVVILTKYFLTGMLQRKEGKILNLASVASKTPGPWQSVYHASKAFVLSFSEAVREEIKNSGVTLTALMPGVTDTDFFNKAEMNSSKILQDKDARANPADVAKDGYDALMAGKDKVISGLKNKVQVAMSNVTPDDAVAHNIYEQQKPVNQH